MGRYIFVCSDLWRRNNSHVLVTNRDAVEHYPVFLLLTFFRSNTSRNSYVQSQKLDINISGNNSYTTYYLANIEALFTDSATCQTISRGIPSFAIFIQAICGYGFNISL